MGGYFLGDTIDPKYIFLVGNTNILCDIDTLLKIWHKNTKYSRKIPYLVKKIQQIPKIFTYICPIL